MLQVFMHRQRSGSRSGSTSRSGRAADPGTDRHGTGTVVRSSHRVLPHRGSHMGPGSMASSVRSSLVGGVGRVATSFVNSLFRMSAGHTHAATPVGQQEAAFGTPLSCYETAEGDAKWLNQEHSQERRRHEQSQGHLRQECHQERSQERRHEQSHEHLRQECHTSGATPTPVPRLGPCDTTAATSHDISSVGRQTNKARQCPG